MARKYSPQFELGSGAFGKAVVVKHRSANKEFVAKVIQVKNLSEVDLDRCVTEVCVMAACNHRNIIQYVEAFVDGGCLRIIMEYARGGDLYQKIENQKGKVFTSEVILNWFVQVVLALQYIHAKGILHRDLKPHNVFLTSDGTIKLGDFGIAKILSHGNDLASTRIGTPFYISPEICAGKQYNSSSDMWAAGCLLFELTLLRVPFNAASLSDLTKHIIQCQFDQIPRTFGSTIPSLIFQLIVFEPDLRLTSSQILQHPQLSEIVATHTKLTQDFRANKSRSNKKQNVSIECSRKEKVSYSNVTDHAENRNYKAQQGHDTDENSGNEAEQQGRVMPEQVGKQRSKHETVAEEKTGKNKAKQESATGEKISFKSEDVNECNTDIVSKESNKQRPPNTDLTLEKGSRKNQLKKADNVVTGYMNVESPKIRKDPKGVEKASCIQNETIPKVVKDDMQKRPRSYSLKDSLKDSVIRKLSAASPKLAETVRLQKLSLSESQKDKETVGCEDVSNAVTADIRDDVFSPLVCRDKDARKNRGSLTYTVHKSHQCTDVTKTNDENNNNTGGSPEINAVLILALSVSRSNRDLAKNILMDKLVSSLGNHRTNSLLAAMKEKIICNGQTYIDLIKVMERVEDRYIPLLTMVLTL